MSRAKAFLEIFVIVMNSVLLCHVVTAKPSFGMTPTRIPLTSLHRLHLMVVVISKRAWLGWWLSKFPFV